MLPPVADVSSDLSTATVIMATIQSTPAPEANEKGIVYANNDVDSSQLSSTHHDFDDLPDPDAGKSDAERAALVRTMPLFCQTN